MPACDHEIDIWLADGHVLCVQDHGAAESPAIFLFHDGLGSRLVNDQLSAAAADAGVRLLSFDRPGFGGSSPRPGRTVADAAADVAAIAEQVGVDRFAVWGASGGCPFALACAAILPDRVAAVAAVAPLAPLPSPGLDWFAGMTDDVAQLHRLAVAGRDRLQPAMAQLAELLTTIDLDRFLRFSLPALPPADQAILQTDAAAHLFAGLRQGLVTGPEGAIEDELALVTPWGSSWPPSACRSASGAAGRTPIPRPATPAGLQPRFPVPSCAGTTTRDTCR